MGAILSQVTSHPLGGVVVPPKDLSGCADAKTSGFVSVLEPVSRYRRRKERALKKPSRAALRRSKAARLYIADIAYHRTNCRKANGCGALRGTEPGEERKKMTLRSSAHIVPLYVERSRGKLFNVPLIRGKANFKGFGVCSVSHNIAAIR